MFGGGKVNGFRPSSFLKLVVSQNVLVFQTFCFSNVLLVKRFVSETFCSWNVLLLKRFAAQTFSCVSNFFLFLNIFLFLKFFFVSLKIFFLPSLSLVTNFIGQVLPSNQSNNLYVFPGLALGAKLCQATLVRKHCFASPIPATAALSMVLVVLEHSSTYPTDHGVGRLNPVLAVMRCCARAVS